MTCKQAQGDISSWLRCMGKAFQNGHQAANPLIAFFPRLGRQGRARRRRIFGEAIQRGRIAQVVDTLLLRRYEGLA